MRSTLVVASVYAGVALAAPAPAPAEQATQAWPWDLPSYGDRPERPSWLVPMRPPKEPKDPKDGRGSSGLLSGLFGGSSRQPKSGSGKNSGSGLLSGLFGGKSGGSRQPSSPKSPAKGPSMPRPKTAAAPAPAAPTPEPKAEAAEAAEAKEETTPTKEETTPTKEESSPAKEETALAKEETAPAKEEAAPTTEETTPAEEEASPSKEETASVEADLAKAEAAEKEEAAKESAAKKEKEEAEKKEKDAAEKKEKEAEAAAKKEKEAAANKEREAAAKKEKEAAAKKEKEAAKKEKEAAAAKKEETAKPQAETITSSPTSSTKHKLWQPKVAAPFQIVLTGTVDAQVKLAPEFVEIFDIDLFNTPKASIMALREQNKKVICYFSAGSSEDWREDFRRFKPADLGKNIAKDDKGKSFWPGEKWLNIRSQNVWGIMKDRIKLAAEKGCHAIDPDNVDAYENKNGIGMTKDDSIKFMKFMAEEAGKYNMSTGLKNAMDILPQLTNVVQFAVNEECAAMNECTGYKNFLKTKPVFHIEYTKTKSGGTVIGTDKEYGKGPDDKDKESKPKQPKPSQSKGKTNAPKPNSGKQNRNQPKNSRGSGRNRKRAEFPFVPGDASVARYCDIKSAPDLGPKFSTVIKIEDLDGWVKFCDGRTSNTKIIKGGGDKKARSRYTVVVEEEEDDE